MTGYIAALRIDFMCELVRPCVLLSRSTCEIQISLQTKDTSPSLRYLIYAVCAMIRQRMAKDTDRSHM